MAADHLAAARRLPAARAEEAARLDALEAQVALGAGRLDEAERLAGVALAVAEPAGLAEVACEALEVAGRVARQRDLEAAGFFAARGDEPVAAACRALLRRAGAPVPRAGRGDSAVPPDLRAIGVTSREADVLALVAEGLTNAQIGGRLHLSPRTVEKHVASLLAKTGGQRRTQLAKYAAALSR